MQTHGMNTYLIPRGSNQHILENKESGQRAFNASSRQSTRPHLTLELEPPNNATEDGINLRT